jgi:hypothetical protein
MPKNFPIMIEVEEIALGAVLRKLHDMPGIAKLDLNLGHGGLGAGKKQLEQQAVAANGNNGRTAEQQVVKLLMDGPLHVREISARIGGSKARTYGALTQLRKKGITEAGPGKAIHQLTRKARAQLGAVPALPAPAAVATRGPGGRASPGSGPIILRAALDAGPVPSTALRKHLVAKGMSPKGISGVLDRGRKHGIIKKNGSGLYELTAKGQKIEIGANHG